MNGVRMWRLAGAALSLAACSACGGVSGAAGESVPGGSVSAESRAVESKPSRLVFVSDGGSRTQAGAVYAYADEGQNQSPLWAIDGAPLTHPSGLWVDGQRNLYVADVSGYVFEYGKPAANGPPSLAFTYDDEFNEPNAVAVCGGYLYASNVLTGGSPGGGSITVWKLGTAAPLHVVQQPSYTEGVGAGITCDASNGKVYFAYNTSYAGPGQIDRYAAGGSGTPVTLPLRPGFISGITFDKSYSNFVLGDGAISFYTRSGKLLQQITAGWVAGPDAFAYEPSDASLWDADAENAAAHEFVPSSGKLENTITNAGGGRVLADPDGVAVSPPDHP